MPIAIGQTASSRELLLEAKRGTDLVYEFEVYEPAGTVAACSRPVQGDPYAFPEGAGIVARALATGTSATVEATAEIAFRGTSTQPAIVRLTIRAPFLELAFVTGARMEVEGDVVMVLSTGIVEDFAGFVVTVEDSAVRR